MSTTIRVETIGWSGKNNSEEFDGDRYSVSVDEGWLRINANDGYEQHLYPSFSVVRLKKLSERPAMIPDGTEAGS